MKYRITDLGKELLSYTDDLWTQHDFNDRAIIKEKALELGLFEEVPERIELCRGLLRNKDFLFIDHGIENHVGVWEDAEIKTAEHAINNEWDKIPECLEFTLTFFEEYNKLCTYGSYRNWIDDKIKALKK